MGSTHATIRNTNFDLFVRSKKKSAVKHSIEKSILLNFLNLSTTFYPIFSEDSDFHFQLSPNSLNLHSLKILVCQKIHFLFKLIFRAIQLQQ